MKVSNLSLRVDLDGDPLIWIGGAGYEESVTFIEGAFRKTADAEAGKELVVALGLRDESKTPRSGSDRPRPKKRGRY